MSSISRHVGSRSWPIPSTLCNVRMVPRRSRMSQTAALRRIRPVEDPFRRHCWFAESTGRTVKSSPLNSGHRLVESRRIVSSPTLQRSSAGLIWTRPSFVWMAGVAKRGPLGGQARDGVLRQGHLETWARAPRAARLSTGRCGRLRSSHLLASRCRKSRCAGRVWWHAR
jgi:hypothetical protein